MEPQWDADAVIVGGGPSGVIAALGIARAGFKVIILDKKPMDSIGHKNCGDALDKMHVDLITEEYGLEPPSLDRGEVRDIIKQIRIAADDLGSNITANTPGYLVDRLVYGQRLLSEAMAAGAEVRPNCAVRGIIIDDDRVIGVKYIDVERKQHTCHAKVILDASGYIGAIRKELPDSLRMGITLTFPDEDTIATYREIIELADDHPYHNEIILLYHSSIPVPGYAWIFSEGTCKLNIGVTWDKSLPYPEGKSLKIIYHDVLDPYFDPKSYKVLYRGGGNIPMRPNFDSLVFPGVLLLGDAAGMVDPTTFEGHGPALESGRLAAKAVIAALEQDDVSVKTLWAYNKAVMTYPGGMHVQSYLAQHFMRILQANGLKKLLDKHLVTDQELREIFQDPDGEVTIWWKLKVFFKAFPYWGTMLRFSRELVRIDKVLEIYEAYPETPEGLASWRAYRDRELKLSFS